MSVSISAYISDKEYNGIVIAKNSRDISTHYLHVYSQNAFSNAINMIILSILQHRMSINFSASTILLSTPRSCLQSPRTEFFFTRMPSSVFNACNYESIMTTASSFDVLNELRDELVAQVRDGAAYSAPAPCGKTFSTPQGLNTGLHL